MGAAIADINSHADSISAADKNIVSNLKGISVDDSLRTGTNTITDIYNLKSSYVLNANVSPAWLGSTFFHDADHIVQINRGDVYDEKTAPGLEAEANAVQMRVGTALGFTDAEKTYLKNDKHTFFNTSPF